MIHIDPILSPHINVPGLVNLENTLASQRAILVEAQACDAVELVAYLQAEVGKTADRLARFEAALAPLGSAVREHDTAKAACVAATHAHGQGSEDRKLALRQRDDVEVAQSAERATRRRLDAAKAALPNLPVTGGGTFDAECRVATGLVETMSAVSANRIFKHRDGQIDEEVWNKWLDLSGDYIRWIPLFLKREVARCEAAWAKHKTADFILSRGESHIADPEDLRSTYAALMEGRATRKAMRVHEARRKLAQAEIEATQ